LKLNLDILYIFVKGTYFLYALRTEFGVARTQTNVILENTGVYVKILEVHGSVLSSVLFDYVRAVQFCAVRYALLRTVVYFYIVF